jgi:hypothetical protein
VSGKVTGDPRGVEELKALTLENRDFLKFLLAEARTSSDHAAPFTGKNGVRYLLKANLATGQLEVTPAPVPA